MLRQVDYSRVNKYLQNSQAQRATPQGNGVAARLEAALKRSQIDEEAVKVSISQEYAKARSVALINSNIGRATTKPIDDSAQKVVAQPVKVELLPPPAKSVISDPIKPKPVEPTPFSPGTVVSGSWGQGSLQTLDSKGTYRAVPGNGQIGFSLGGYEGYLLPNLKGVATNPQTGKSVTFDVAYSDHEFKFTNIQEMTPPQPSKGGSRLVWEGGIKDGVVASENMNLKIDKSGHITASIKVPKSADATVGDKDTVVQGEGFIDQQGNLVLALSNGATYRARYSEDGGKFRIYDHEYVG